MKLKQLIYGISTFLPGMNRIHVKGTGGTDSARYCYSVWLRHLVMAKRNGLNPYPKTIAELGPGDTLGIGLAALISGCEKYFAFDVVKYADIKRNLSVFHEIVTLFRNRVPIPGNDEWPQINPRLEDYTFPFDIFSESTLSRALNTFRIDRIKKSLEDPYRHDSMIQYKVPWYGAGILDSESVDMIYSQAVLEHVDDLGATYNAMHAWLKSGGFISHTIDFKCHGTADEWNGHWVHSDLTWKLIRGRRPFLINREPHSKHIAALRCEGFIIVRDQTSISRSIFNRDQLAPQFISITEEDLVTSGTFIQAVKEHAAH